MIPPQLIVAGVIAVASAGTGFGAAWKIQNGIQAERELEYAETALENERLVAKTRTRNDQAVIHAVNAGVARGTAIRRDSDLAGISAVRLRDDEIARTVRDAATSLDACTVRAVALGELLVAATESNRRLAGAADRHASDIRTIMQAWPK